MGTFLPKIDLLSSLHFLYIRLKIQPIERFFLLLFVLPPQLIRPSPLLVPLRWPLDLPEDRNEIDYFPLSIKQGGNEDVIPKWHASGRVI